MEPLPRFRYLEPATIAEAASLLAAHSGRAMLIGGGTDLLASMRQGIFSPKVVVSLRRIDGLDAIRWEEGAGLRIGALATMHSIQTDAEVLRRYPVLASAAHEIGSPQLRRMATAGGNLCLDTRCYYYNQSERWKACGRACVKVGGDYCMVVDSGRAKKCFAVFSADLAPALVALGADITLASARGERRLALADFYTGAGERPNTRQPDEIVTDIHVPARSAGMRAAYLKYRVRRAIDYPIASVALALRLAPADRVCEDACLVVSGVGARPAIAREVTPLVIGRPIDDAQIARAAELARKAARPVDNTAGVRTHRRAMIHELTRRAFARALADA